MIEHGLALDSPLAKKVRKMTNLPTRDRSHLRLVVSDVVAPQAIVSKSVSSVLAGRRSSIDVPTASRAAAPARSSVRLIRTAQSSECADNLVDAYHRERLVTPFRSVLRVDLSETIDRDMLALAVSELESRGWTVTSATIAEDISSARALWLRPYA